MIIEDIIGKEIVNTRVSKEFKQKLNETADERYLMTSRLIRKMLYKFVEDPEGTLEFLRGV